MGRLRLGELSLLGPILGASGDARGEGQEELRRIEELQAGSEGAFDGLISQYAPLVYRLACRLLNDPAEASDTVQEVFLKVFRNMGQFQGHCSLKTWIYRITLNTASNQNRWWRRHREQECPLDSPDGRDGEQGSVTAGGSADFAIGHCADQGPSPFESVLRRETQEMVHTAMLRLSDSSRRVLVLREMEGLSYDEVADILHVSLGTVKSRLARARQSLKLELESMMQPALRGAPVWSPAK